ncbi:MAG: hypothetical protein LBM71_00160 [Elusimicrobiota bacterium]|jgi:hypothetical protein|nr:hypothetical protein [Elusimicrobiota bacterium]
MMNPVISLAIKKICLLTFLLLPPFFQAHALFDGALSFAPQVNLAAMQSEDEFYSNSKPKKLLLGEAQLPLTLTLFDSVFVEANYILRFNRSEPFQTQNTYSDKLQKLNINFQNDDLFLKIGRQDYVRANRDFVIYYGSPKYIDARPSTSVNGLLHGNALGLLSYELMAAKQTDEIAFESYQPTIYGASLQLGSPKLAYLDLFYYYADNNGMHFDKHLTVWGGGVNFNLNDAIKASFYGFANNGDEAFKLYYITARNEYKGYGFTGDLAFMSEGDYFTNTYTLGFFYTPKPYLAIAQNMDMGVIFGSTDGAPMSPNDPAVNFNYLDLLIYSLKINITAKDFLENARLDLNIYDFSRGADTVDNKHIGSELDLKLAYDNGRFGAQIFYGFFVSGEALKHIGQDNKKIHKLGANMSMRFAF